MKIKLAEGSQPPPNEPVLVVLDGNVQTPDVDYALEEGELPDFRFPTLRPMRTATAVLMLIPRMTHLVFEQGPGNPSMGTKINSPVSYEVRWDDDEMTGMTAYDNKVPT